MYYKDKKWSCHSNSYYNFTVLAVYSILLRITIVFEVWPQNRRSFRPWSKARFRLREGFDRGRKPVSNSKKVSTTVKSLFQTQRRFRPRSKGCFKLREGFGAGRKLPASSGVVSAQGESFPQTQGRFRRRAKTCRELRYRFGAGRKHSTDSGSFWLEMKAFFIEKRTVMKI
jgi:hypothetical protein